MKKQIGLWVCLLALPFLPGCGKKEEAAAVVEDGKFAGAFTCEEHWMVALTARDLQGMAALAGAPAADAEAKPTDKEREYQIGAVTLAMAPSCWDVESYRPLLEPWDATATAATSAAPDLLGDLLVPRASVIQKANEAVSARIKAAPVDPRVHEEAAFLLGVFGVRENARAFGDLRPLICRMTAHLALAEHLRDGAEATDVGKWAHVLYDLHAGRPIDALEGLEALPAEGNSGRWKRAVNLLVTGDWRRTQDLAEPSLMEAIAHARALREHRGNPQMLEFAGTREDLQGTPEWSRLLLAPKNSVEDGHLAMKSTIAMEFAEISEIFTLAEEPDPDDVAKHLGKKSPQALIGADGVARVISDGDWAAYFRRHLFQACSDVSRFTHKKWSSHEAAVEWEASLLPYCRALPGHELVEPLVATDDDDFEDDLVKTAAFIRSHPEQVPVALWFDYRFPNLKSSASTPMPNQKPWFREVSPPGTAHDPQRRIRFTGIHDGRWLDVIRALHLIDPWDSELCYELAENTGNDLASVKKAWGTVRDYSKRPLLQTLESEKLTAAERIETLKILSPLDPESGLKLGIELVRAEQPDEAIKAFELAFEEASDRVSVANQTFWMIHHYKSRGDDAKAREIADHNAEVFSFSGLLSAMTLAIVEKDAKRANGYARDIAERYDDPRYIPIAAWGAGGDVKSLRKVFPDGLKEVTPADFPAKGRVAGARIDDDSDLVRASGLRPGDVIVAVDGKRVENFPQYLLLMSITLEPRTRFIYRRGSKTLEAECLLPWRRLDTGMSDAGE